MLVAPVNAQPSIWLQPTLPNELKPVPRESRYL
jgi:hypothetical protein